MKGFVPRRKFTPFMKDLVILTYADNTNTTMVRDSEPNLPDGLRIDLDTCTWIFDEKRYHIGQMRRCEQGCRWGVIGVYNRQNIQHLSYMLHHSHEAVRERLSFHDTEYA